MEQSTLFVPVSRNRCVPKRTSNGAAEFEIGSQLTM